MTRHLRAVPATRPRALGYIRVSRERDDMISPELQETAIREHCARNGYDLVEVLEPDLDMSGRFWKRRRIGDAIARVEAGEADVIVVWKISRVARQRLDWNVAVDRVESVGGRLESATEPIDASTSSGRFSRGVLAELAAFESERIAEGWKETHAQRWRRGLPHNGKPRFGYIYSRSSGFTIDPATAPLVAELYNRYLAGENYTQLHRWLNTSMPGRFTSYRTLSKFMDAGFAAGWIVHHDTNCPLPHRDGNQGQCKNVVREKGAHEPIVDPTAFDEYLAARHARNAMPPRIKAPTTAFAGIIHCAACGHRYVHKTLGGRSVYRCGNRACSRPGTVSRRRVEAVVLAGLPEIASDLNKAADRSAGGGAARAAERIQLERTQLDADRALVNLTKDRAARILPEDIYATARDELLAERGRAAARLREIADDPARDRARARLVSDLMRDWESLTEEERNHVLREVCVVHVDPVHGLPQPRPYPAWDAPQLPA